MLQPFDSFASLIDPFAELTYDFVLQRYGHPSEVVQSVQRREHKPPVSIGIIASCPLTMHLSKPSSFFASLWNSPVTCIVLKKVMNSKELMSIISITM